MDENAFTDENAQTTVESLHIQLDKFLDKNKVDSSNNSSSTNYSNSNKVFIDSLNEI